MREAFKLAAVFVAGIATTALLLRVLPDLEQPTPLSRAKPISPTVSGARPAVADSARISTPTAASATAPAPTAPPTVEQIQRAQIAALQDRVRDLERKAMVRQPQDRDAGRAVPAKVHGFTDAELKAMAQNCEIRFDLPHISREPFRLSPDQGARLHLSEADQEQVSAAVTRINADVLAHLRAFYIEATGDVASADLLEPLSLMQEIMEKSPPESVKAATAEIARERAGFPTQPKGTIAERYLRYVVGVSDALQANLEPVLGMQTAAAVRDALAMSKAYMSGCPTVNGRR